MNNQFHLSFAVKGNALEPRLRDGEHVIVDTRLEPDTDDEVVLIAKDGSTNVFGLEGIAVNGTAYFQSLQGDKPFHLKPKDIKAMYVVVAIQCVRGQVRYD
jgi:phage repressor protein C with HTH and peptisase S24 domain